MPEEKKNAVVYARYSSHKQGEQSIEGQLAAAYKYAKENDLRIVHEYIDRAQSGRSDNREQFQEMLRDTAKKQFETIILWKVDRFGRNREEIAFNKHRCKKNGVNVVYVAENIPDSAEGIILESVLEGMAEYYSLQLAANVKRGRLVGAQKCQSIGGVTPTGYRINPVTKAYDIDPDAAQIVKLVFTLCAGGATTAAITREVNRRGYRNSKGKEFTRSGIYTMLTNERYKGIYIYKDLVREEGGMPRIIDDDTFEKVQEMLRTNKRAPSKRKNNDRHDFILTGKLYCGHCGIPMSGTWGTSKTGATYGYYLCGNRKKHKCDKKPIRQDAIESKIISIIVAMLHDNKTIDRIADAVYRYVEETREEDQLTISLKKQLNEVVKSQNNIMRAIEAGIFNETTKNRMDELDAQKAELERESAEQELSSVFKITKVQIKQILSQMAEKDLSTSDAQRKLVNTFVNAIYVYDDKLIITFNYSGDDRKVTIDDIETLETFGKKFDCHSQWPTKNKSPVWGFCFCTI